jgi:hypothetical protein
VKIRQHLLESLVVSDHDFEKKNGLAFLAYYSTAVAPPIIPTCLARVCILASSDIVNRSLALIFRAPQLGVAPAGKPMLYLVQFR